MSSGRALRLTLAAAEAALSEALAEVPCSWAESGAGLVSIWVDEADAAPARQALRDAGLAPWEETLEPATDWVEAAAALRRPVAVGGYLLDPHEGERAASPGPRRRLWLPAARAFGTGSHESTRLALRLLLASGLRGLAVLDVGCGAGPLAIAAALEGASRVVAFDLDADAALATREHASANGAPRVEAFAGGVEAISPCASFDVVVGNLLQEELSPILPALRRLCAPRAILLTSGQLRAREEEWTGRLRRCGFVPERLVAEGEWLGVRARAA